MMVVVTGEVAEIVTDRGEQVEAGEQAVTQVTEVLVVLLEPALAEPVAVVVVVAQVAGIL